MSTMKIAVIGDSDTVSGFRLGGVTSSNVVKDGEPIDAILKELIADETVGVIAITERVADANRSAIDEANKGKKAVTPILVEIPDKNGPIVREVDPLKALIKSAIGVEV
ncbi:MAG: V-type ATP synthase subunit F [Methanothrix harundinacea]|uniref:A-type ATP synthase subunit F n=1 Tax=Methanothrix harundinacea TaxID=301375 RepID=A0A101FTF9_9EURY|nr:MAG: V-type ATP synthase subunit F [Methanothrix harundinacea]KUK97312.1 MAG: V-type ATP synthase subunit F [Methanothrix harundinacea]MCP1392746.1 V-type ATP synthase subunit F [Methanothrix harundinacea]